MNHEDGLTYGERCVADASVDARAAFIMKTYTHLAGALCGFIGIELYLFSSGLAERIAVAMLSVPWLVILGAFMIVGWIASRTAHSARSIAFQYSALAAFVTAEAILFVPLLHIANQFAPGAIESAVYVSLAGFAGLTAVAFITRKDFSFLRGILMFGAIAALIAIGAGAIFGFELGTWFSVGMVVFAGAAILYDTSNIIHHYPEDRYVGASLELFASVALLFWYVLRLFMSSDD